MLKSGQKLFLKQMVVLIKFTMQLFMHQFVNNGKKYIVGDTGAGYAENVEHGCKKIWSQM